MINKITQITIIILVVLLLASLTGNVIQYAIRKPLVETVFVTDTLVRVDTVIKTVINRVIVDRPVPVNFDSLSNIRTYRDTIHHQYGTIRREEMVFGELLKKHIEFDLRIPEVQRTITISNNTTQTIRTPLLFGTIGIGSDMNGKSTITPGLIYVPKSQKMLIGMEYNLNNEFNFKIGLNFLR